MTQIQRTGTRLLILDDVPAGLAVLQRDLVVVHWNSMLERWTGVPREGILGRSIEQVLPRSAAANLVPALQKLESGAKKVSLLLRRDDPLAPPRSLGHHAALLSELKTRVLDEPCYLLTISAPPDPSIRAESSSGSQDSDELSIRSRLHEIGIDEDPASLTALMGDFIDSAGNLASRLLEAVHHEDRKQVAAIAHRLAGAAVTLGAKQLGSKARELETTIDDLLTEALELLVGELVGQVERVRGICRGML